MFTHRPLIGVVACFASGIVLGQYLSGPFGILSVLTFLLLLLGWIFIDRNFFSTIFLSLALIGAGNVVLLNRQTLPGNHIKNFIRPYEHRIFLIEGIAISDVQKRTFRRSTKTVFTLEVKSVFKTPFSTNKPGERLFHRGFENALSGKVLVNIFRDLEINYGDDVLLAGKLHPPFDFSADKKFSYGEYLKQKGIHLILSVRKQGRVDILRSHQGNRIQEIALDARKKLKSVLTQHLKKNAAGIMNALILGERYDISKDIKDLFIKTGTAHILAISGFNVGIVAFLIFLVLKVLRFKRNAQYFLTILILIFYALLTGAQASVVRATIMAVVFLFSFLVERETDSLNSLALAALIILGWNPFNLFDVGFQLSFMSVFFIIQGFPRLWGGITRRWNNLTFKPAIFLLQSLSVSIVAWVGVAGLIAYYFHIVTPITILANLIIIPLTSLNTALGLGLMFVGLVCPSLAFVFEACIDLTLNLMMALIYFLSKVPGAYFNIRELTAGEVIFYYLVIFFIMSWQSLFKKILFLRLPEQNRSVS